MWQLRGVMPAVCRGMAATYLGDGMGPSVVAGQDQDPPSYRWGGEEGPCLLCWWDGEW